MSQLSHLVILLWGTHGTEKLGSLYVRNEIVRLLRGKNNGLIVDMLGPISPWSCRNGYRFYITLTDPNRWNDENKTILHSDYMPAYNLWKKIKPRDFLQLNLYLAMLEA